MLSHIPVEVEHVMVVELIENLAAFLPVAYQTGGAEGAELMGDGGFRGGEMGGDIAHAMFLFFQQGDEPQPGGICQNGEEFTHALGLGHAQREGVCGGGMVVFLTNGFAGWTGSGAGHVSRDTIFRKLAMDKYMSVCSYIAPMNTTTESACACPDCKCQVTPGHHVAKDGKDFCSEACASGHTSGDGCCNNTCTCHG